MESNLSLNIMHESILEITSEDVGFNDWINSFDVDDYYRMYIINIFTYVEYILREDFNLFMDYEYNRDMANSIMDMVEDGSISAEVSRSLLTTVIGQKLQQQC